MPDYLPASVTTLIDESTKVRFHRSQSTDTDGRTAAKRKTDFGSDVADVSTDTYDNKEEILMDKNR